MKGAAIRTTPKKKRKKVFRFASFHVNGADAWSAS